MLHVLFMLTIRCISYGDTMEGAEESKMHILIKDNHTTSSSHSDLIGRGGSGEPYVPLKKGAFSIKAALFNLFVYPLLTSLVLGGLITFLLNVPYRLLLEFYVTSITFQPSLEVLDYILYWCLPSSFQFKNGSTMASTFLGVFDVSLVSLYRFCILFTHIGNEIKKFKSYTDIDPDQEFDIKDVMNMVDEIDLNNEGLPNLDDINGTPWEDFISEFVTQMIHPCIIR